MINHTELKEYILSKFIEWDYDLVYKMNTCYHYYQNKKINPYHMENGIFNHTCLVLKDIPTYHNSFHSLINIISAIMHDVGKIYTRTEDVEKEKTYFRGHEYASIQPTIDFIYYLYKNNLFNYDEMIILFNICLPIISNHLEIKKKNLSYSDYKLYLNNNYCLMRHQYDLCNADNNGRFQLYDPEKHKEQIDNSLAYNIQYYNELIEYLNNNKLLLDVFKYSYNPDIKCNIKIFAGVPGVGKDYLANKECDIIMSYDKIRINEFLKYNPNTYNSSTELYKYAFDFCNNKQIDLNSILMMDIKSYHEKYPNNIIGICNTHCNRKSRNKLLNSIYNLKTVKENSTKIELNYIISTSDTIKNRNNNRLEDKILPESVINNFLMQQVMSNYLEKFDKINLIFNE